MKRIALLAIATFAAVSVASAGGSNVKPLSPAQTQAMATAGVTHGGGGIAQQLSPAQMSALTGTPLSALEGTSGPSGAVAATPDATAASSAIYCWSFTDGWTEWGLFPVQQRVTEYRNWCGYYGGAQTYRSSSVHLGTTLCSHSGEWQARISGGNGYTWTVVRTGGSFACPTPIPWITLHYDRWQDWSANTWGSYAQVGNS